MDPCASKQPSAGGGGISCGGTDYGVQAPLDYPGDPQFASIPTCLVVAAKFRLLGGGVFRGTPGHRVIGLAVAALAYEWSGRCVALKVM